MTSFFFYGRVGYCTDLSTLHHAAATRFRHHDTLIGAWSRCECCRSWGQHSTHVAKIALKFVTIFLFINYDMLLLFVVFIAATSSDISITLNQQDQRNRTDLPNPPWGWLPVVMIVGWWRSCWLLAQMQIWRMYMKRTWRRGYSDREFIGPKLFPVGKFSRLVHLKKSPNNWSPEKHHHIPNLHILGFKMLIFPGWQPGERHASPWLPRFGKSPRPKNTTPEVMETHLRAWKSNKFWRMLPRCSPYLRWKTNWIPTGIFYQGL